MRSSLSLIVVDGCVVTLVGVGGVVTFVEVAIEDDGTCKEF